MRHSARRVLSKKLIWTLGVGAAVILSAIGILFFAWSSSPTPPLEAHAWNYYNEQIGVISHSQAKRSDIKKTCYRDADPRHGVEVGPLICQAEVDRQLSLGEVSSGNEDIPTRLADTANGEGFKTDSAPDSGYYSAHLSQCNVNLSFNSDNEVYDYRLVCSSKVDSVIKGYTFTPTYWYPYCSPIPPKDIDTAKQCF